MSKERQESNKLCTLAGCDLNIHCSIFAGGLGCFSETDIALWRVLEKARMCFALRNASFAGPRLMPRRPVQTLLTVTYMQ